MRAKASFSLLEVCVVCCLLSFGTWIIPIDSSQAAVPDSINYQGKLTRAGGGPVNGTFDLTFSIYPDDLGSPADWTEIQPQVEVEHGVFSVLLGSVNPISASLFDGSVKYLGVKVEDDPEMTPLKPMVTTSYAFRSQETDTAEYARTAPPDDDWDIDTAGFNIYRLTGNVGIGTPSPQYKLDIADTAQMTGFKMPTGAFDGYVLTSDANGLASWQDPPGLPSGVIVMWSGPIDSIPDGWALCDGTNGTPDLRDKFIKSVPNSLTDPGATGGTSTHNHGSESYTAPSHQHTLPIGFEGSLWIVDQTSGNVTTGWNTDGGSYPPQSKPRLISDSGGGGTITGTSASASSLPPYYELAYIMKL